MLATAPVVFALVLAATVAYEPWWGRFFVFPVALAAASAGVFLRTRALAWGVVAVAVTTLALSLRANEEKPLAVWGEPRWEVQTRVGPRNGEVGAIRFAEQSIPPRARVGLAVRWLDWSYPFFGRRLERAVRFVPSTTSARRDLGWLVVAPTKGVPGAGWALVFRAQDGWRVFASRFRHDPGS